MSAVGIDDSDSMKMRREGLPLWIFASIMVIGCTATSKTPRSEAAYTICPTYPGWVNLHGGDPDLAGISFIGDGDAEAYVGKHPSGVMYVFWDGRVRQTSHKPDGSLQGDFWHRVAHWNRLDYSFGSDPNFERHDDPRKKQQSEAGGEP